MHTYSTKETSMHYDIDAGFDYPLCPLDYVAHQFFEQFTSLLRKHWQLLGKVNVLFSQLYPPKCLSSSASIEEPVFWIWTRCIQVADKSTNSYLITFAYFQPLGYTLYPTEVIEGE